MCIFAGPVESVSKTRIAVFTDGDEGLWRFTAYQMTVELGEGGNAMILPVPSDSGINLIDMSNCKDFFDRLDKMWPMPQAKGMSRGGFAVASANAYLEVHKVGSYEVSIANSVDDIKRVDPSVFTLSRATERLLRKSYPNKSAAFSFIVAKLTEGGEIHPLGYSYDAANVDEVFIPTRHGHGDEGSLHAAINRRVIPHVDPEWDHTVYIQGSDFMAPDGEPGHTIVARSRVGLADNERILQGIVDKVPEIFSFIFTRRPVNRIRWNGRLKNIDARMVAS